MDTDFKNARDRALKYLAIKNRCSWEIKTYLLKKQYSQAVAEEVVKYLLENKYIDDSSYVQEFIAKKLRQGQGRNKIKNQLLVKGINSDMLNTIGEEYSDDLEYIEAERLINKKFGKNIDKKIIPKAARFLFSRGYTTGTIKKLFNDYC